jgi:hypothetical protein
MKGKLIKLNVGVGYRLNDENDYLIASTLLSSKTKLSFSNCQKIELGYDLDELAKHNSLSYTWIGVESNRDKVLISKYAIEGFKKGFQKALEILGDKKFTENNIDEAFDAGYEMLDSPKKYNDTLKTFKESLEQTEWDVEIVCLHTGDPEHTTNTGLPKLDEDGCLILKRL